MTPSSSHEGDRAGCEMCENGESCIHCIGAERDRYRAALEEINTWDSESFPEDGWRMVAVAREALAGGGDASG